jgi:hypothetical protein
MRLTLCSNACEIRRPIRSNYEDVVADSKVLAITAAYVNTYRPIVLLLEKFLY